MAQSTAADSCIVKKDSVALASCDTPGCTTQAEASQLSWCGRCKDARYCSRACQVRLLLCIHSVVELARFDGEYLGFRLSLACHGTVTFNNLRHYHKCTVLDCGQQVQHWRSGHKHNCTASTPLHLPVNEKGEICTKAFVAFTESIDGTLCSPCLQQQPRQRQQAASMCTLWQGGVLQQRLSEAALASTQEQQFMWYSANHT
jgi:hypothetical protein